MRPILTTLILSSLLLLGGSSIATINEGSLCPHDHANPKACPPAGPASVGGTSLEYTVVSKPMSATDEGPQVPCSDPRGCPDLMSDPDRMRPSTHFATFSSSSCSVIEGHTEPGIRKLVRFTFTTPNFGDGDLIIGAPADHPEWFEWSPCHGHYHFREYADYRLWTVLGYELLTILRGMNWESTTADLIEQYPFLASQFVAGHKQGFCVVDMLAYEDGAPARYRDCATNQGISVGWADQYHWRLDGQWVDVTDVPSGAYILEGEVNAEQLYEESDYSNNSAAVAFNLI